MGGVFQSVLYLEPVVDDMPVDVEQEGRSVTIDVEQEGRSVATRRKGRPRRAACKCVYILVCRVFQSVM